VDSVTRPSPAMCSGGEIALASAQPPDLVGRLAERVAARPDGVIRSYSLDGHHRATTRAALWQNAGDIAAALALAGARPGSIVVLLIEDVLDFIPAFWACWRGGFIAVPLMSAAKDKIYRGDRAFADALSLLPDPFVLVDAAFAALFERHAAALPGTVVALSAVAASAQWRDPASISGPACLVATSGSTGTLKLVELSHSTLVYRNFARTNAPKRELPHSLGIFPLDSVTGQHVLYLHHDTWTQISAQALTVRPTAVLDAVEEFGISVVNLTSAMAGRILAGEARLDRRRKLHSLRMVAVGAEPVNSGVLRDFARLLQSGGAPADIVVAGYGTSETGSLVKGSSALLTADLQAPVCLGPPWVGVDMRIVGDDGAVAEADALGELEVCCPEKIFSGYWGDPALTRASFTADGWWKTGDLGQIVGGELYLRGRVKEVFIAGGKKFSLADIDAEIQSALAPGDVGYALAEPGARGGPETLAVVVAAADAARFADLAQAIKRAVSRRFALQIERIVAVAAGDIPRSAAGKLRRHALSALRSGAPQAPADAVAARNGAGSDDPALRTRLERIWNDALGRDGPVLPHANFFDHGGDSLRSLTLHLQIVEAFGVEVPSDEFFAYPTFANLLRLVQSGGARPKTASDASDIAWPLAPALRNRMLAALETWAGERPTSDRTILGFNRAGTKPPIFWVFNSAHEPVQLAKALGSEQPLYAIRSGVEVSDYNEDEVQNFALRYISDIGKLSPEGPIFIGGNCQGAIIALAIAQHALRRKRHVPLLMLMDWAFEPHAYGGSVLLISGRDNVEQNARLLFTQPELAFNRAFPDFEFVEIPGAYAEGFNDGLVEILAEKLTSRMAASLSEPTRLMPASAYQAMLRCDNSPAVMVPGGRRSIAVTVTNAGDVTWAPTPVSGLMLGGRWLDATGALLPGLQPKAALPEIGPRRSIVIELPIVAPPRKGEFLLSLDLSEEGARWFHPDPAAGSCRRVQVVSRMDMLWRRLTGSA